MAVLESLDLVKMEYLSIQERRVDEHSVMAHFDAFPGTFTNYYGHGRLGKLLNRSCSHNMNAQDGLTVHGQITK